MFGPAPKDVLKAEVHGSLGPGVTFELRTGPTSYPNGVPQTVIVSSRAPGRGLVPAGYITAFFPASIFEQSRDLAEPVKLVLDYTLSLPLSTPRPPQVDGPRPPSLPFTALLRAEDLERLLGAHKAKLTFLRKSVSLYGSTLKEAQAAVRLAVCHLSSPAQSP